MSFGYIGDTSASVKQQVKNKGILTTQESFDLERQGYLGGSLKLIETQTVSSSVASLNFNSIEGEKYDTHLLEIRNIIGETDNKPTYLRFSNDNGTSFEAGTSYEYAFDNGGYGNTTFEQHKSTGTSAIFLSNNAGNDTNETSNFYCYVYNANNSSKYTTATFQGAFFYQSTSAFVMNYGGGVYDTAETINAFQIIKSSGNLTQGKVSLYGIKQ